MAASRIQFTRSAEKEFGKLPRSVQARFATAIDVLAQAPTRARPGVDVKRLRGTRGAWRLRVGDFRGIYEVEPRLVIFTRFGQRSKIYDT